MAANAVAFVAALPPGAPEPTALHFDVEPHQIWTVATMNATANDYLTMLDNVHAQLAGSGLAFYVDIPFHYDNKAILVGTTTQMLHQWVLAAVDGVTVMDYRDTATHIVNQGQTIVTDAATAGKSVVIGLMTTAASPTSTTFFEEGPVALETAMALTTSTFEASATWTGFAVENYTGYVALMHDFFPAFGVIQAQPACKSLSLP